ncbi:MAG: TRAP transporter substrate-binding protein [Mailhella sp.]|nr:TRAP transporter substrate-binding protein [Mailhella sp.]
MTLRRILLAAAAALLIAGQAEAATTLRFANFPPSSTFPCISAEHWISELQKRTDKVKVDHYPGGTLIDARNMVRGIIRGQADIGCFNAAYYPGMFPLTSAFELPFGAESSRQISAVLLKFLNEFKPAELSKLKIITAFSTPPAQVISKKPVASLEDIKGLRLRASGNLANALELLGGMPVSMPQSETPDAIQRGAIEGVFTSLDVVKDFNMGETCRSVLMTHMSASPFIVVMNLKTWNSLPDDVKKIIDDLSAPTSAWTAEYLDTHCAESLEWGRQTYGVTVTQLPAEKREEALRTIAPLIEKWEKDIAAKNLPAAKALEFIRTELKK